MDKRHEKLGPAETKAFVAWIRTLAARVGGYAAVRRNLRVAKATLARILGGNVTKAIAKRIERQFDMYSWPADYPTPPWRVAAKSGTAPAASPPRPVDEVMAFCAAANALSSPAYDLLTRLMEFRAAGEALTPRKAIDAVGCLTTLKGVIT